MEIGFVQDGGPVVLEARRMGIGGAGMVVVDADGIVREWDAGAARLFGHAAADVVGGTVEVIVPERYRAAHRARFDAVVAGADPRIEGRGAHLPVLCADGGVRTFPGRFTLVRDAWGMVVGAAAAFGEPAGAEPFSPVTPAAPGPGARVRRVVANLPVADPAVDADFWAGLFGLEPVFSLGWIVNHGGRVQLVGRDATAPEDSAVSVEVADVDRVHADAVARGFEIVHPLTDEPWGVRRFFVRTPGGVVVNILAHG